MTTTRRRRSVALGAALLAGATVLAACGSDDDDTTATTSGEGPLAGICPETVVIQADWEPEVEHGGIYQLLGDDYTIDANAKSVTGPLVIGGEDAGVDVEIRIGGTSVGFQSAQALLYQDRDIMFGYGRLGEVTIAQEDNPVTAVLASMEISPYAVYWDAETYPYETIGEVNDAGATISIGSGEDIWAEYLLATGVLDDANIDRSDQNKPAAFVAAQGTLAEAGFITAEPFMYEEEIPEWGKPVTGQLVHDMGYPEYFQALVVRSEDVEKQAECLTELVPAMQQAQVDFVADPEHVLDLVVELVEEYDTGWVYTREGGEFAHGEAVERGIFADGPDGVQGSFDLARVQTLIDIVAEHVEPGVASITPEELATNEFLDTSISQD